MDSARIAVRLQPRAGRNKIVGRRAGVPRSQVAIVRGERSRDKVVEVEGLDEKTLHAALGVG
jgi:uncharacterized protein YggU (UPF0235/DUF167 family)